MNSAENSTFFDKRMKETGFEMNKVTGIILAGGKSSRMGKDKGLLMLNGKPMIQYVIDRLEELGVLILIVANHDQYQQFNYPVVEDLLKEKGPLGGIYTGLQHSESEINIVLSCDTPYIPTKLLELLLAESTGEMITIPKFRNKKHPLIGVYKRETLKMIHSNVMSNQLKLMKVCSDLGAKEVSIPEALYKEIHFSNINTQRELKELTI